MNGQKSIGERILHAGVLITLAHALFKIAGLIQLQVMGHFLGARIVEVVYVTAFQGCVLTLFLVGEEIIGPAFLPVFMGEKDKSGESAAWKFANTVLSVQFLILLIVSALVMLFPEHVIRLLTAWDEGSQPDKFHLAAKSLVWSAPALMCLSLGSTTYMVLNGYKRFFLAALGDASWKFVVALSVLFGVYMFGTDYRVLILGLLLGSIAKLVTHLAGLFKELRFLRFDFSLRNPAMRTVAALMLPLLCGILFGKIRDVFNNVWVLSHLETDGLMQANMYGRTLFGAIGWLIPYALSIAMFPFLCEMVDRNDRKEFSRILSQSTRLLLAVFIPLSLVCVVLAKPLTFLLFRGGEFTDQIASWTALSMACYILVLPASAVEYLFMQAFFAHRKMVAVTVVGIVFSTLSMVVSGAGIVWFGLRGEAALAVVALGFTLSRILKSSTLAVLMRPHMEQATLSGIMLFLTRALSVGLLSAALCFLCTRGFEMYISAGTGLMTLLLKLSAGSTGAVAGFLAGAWLMRLEEPGIMLEWIKQKWLKRTASNASRQ